MNGDVAIAHWSEHVDGGGERVAWEAARGLDAPLFVGYRDEDIEPGGLTDVREVFDGRLQQWAIERGGITRELAQIVGWHNTDCLREFDVLVSTSNQPLWHVGAPEQAHVHYVHHTARYQTDLLSGYGSSLFDRLARVHQSIKRLGLMEGVRRPDLFVANSEIIARRIQRYWDVDEEDIRVVYPPVATDSFAPGDAPTEDYYLSLSRLDELKRIGEVIKAFRELDHELVIAGDGGDRERLEALADGAENIRFVGYVDESEKRRLMSEAKATINNALAEDFGITTVESFAAGTPVIGVREGMTEFLVRDGRTGISYDRGVDNLRDAVEALERGGLARSERSIAAWADRFCVDRFVGEMRDAVDEARERARVDVSWEDEVPTTDGESIPAVADGGER